MLQCVNPGKTGILPSVPLYFAFGSNLDPAQLAQRDIRPSAARRATLRDWALVFNKIATLNAVPNEGRANIIPTPGDTVEGIGFSVTGEDLAILDRFEGVATGHYRRTEVDVWFAEGGRGKAVTYVAMLTGSDLHPSAWYRDTILAGARHFRLPPAYIHRLESWPAVGSSVRPVTRV